MTLFASDAAPTDVSFLSIVIPFLQTKILRRTSSSKEVWSFVGGAAKVDGVGAQVRLSSVTGIVSTFEASFSISGDDRLLGHLGLLQVSVCLIYELVSFPFYVESIQSCVHLSLPRTLLEAFSKQLRDRENEAVVLKELYRLFIILGANAFINLLSNKRNCYYGMAQYFLDSFLQLYRTFLHCFVKVGSEVASCESRGCQTHKINVVFFCSLVALG